MSDHPIVLAVASYPSRSTAERDLHALTGLRHQARVDQVAAAAVEKGANGWLEIARHHSSATPLAWGGVLLGSALTVVAAPLGIKILASVLATRAAMGGGRRDRQSLLARSPQGSDPHHGQPPRSRARPGWWLSPSVTTQGTSPRSCPTPPPRS